jgi:hypothetical protein
VTFFSNRLQTKEKDRLTGKVKRSAKEKRNKLFSADGIFHSFAETEFNSCFSRNFNRFAGCRVATFTRFAGGFDQFSEARKREFSVLFDFAGSESR